MKAANQTVDFRTPLVLAAALCAFAFGACQEAPKSPAIPELGTTATMKPDSVSTAQVAFTALSEVSHLERALKPMLGQGFTLSDCQKLSSSSKAMWEIRWDCGVDSTEPARKEIQGRERINFDQASRTLTYLGQFETRNFNDREPRESAHTLVTTRKITIQTPDVALDGSGGKVRMVSSGVLKNASTIRVGSNWESKLEGDLQVIKGVWSLSNATITFKGVLFGLDGERLTKWAAGDFKFVSQKVTLSGLGQKTCTKPVGDWKMTATGGGIKFDSTVATNESGGMEENGGHFVWPTNLCDRP